MRGLKSTALLGLVLAGLVAYIYFYESKREPAAGTEAKKEKVFTVEQAKIGALSIASSSGESTTLEKQGDRWKLLTPVATDADEAEVSSVVSNISSLEMQRVVEEAAKDLKPYGLDPPRVDVGFKAEGDKEFRHLQIGDKTATGGDLYARLASDRRVFLISGFLDSTFDRKTFDLRDKTVLKFERDKIDGVEVRTAQLTLRFVKADDAWRMMAPIEARADFGAVEGLIGRFNTGQMRAIADAEPADLKKYGLEPPEYAVTLNAGSARSMITIGTKTPEGTFYAKDAARPMVFTVESFLTDDLKKAPADYRPKDLFEFRSFSGTRFEVVRGSTSTVFEKQKGKDASTAETWVQSSPATKADETKIVDFLSKFSNLRADSFVDSLPAGATEVASVIARFGENKKEERVTFLKAGSDMFATRPGEPGAAKVLSSEFDDAVKLLDAVK